MDALKSFYKTSLAAWFGLLLLVTLLVATGYLASSEWMRLR